MTARRRSDSFDRSSGLGRGPAGCAAGRRAHGSAGPTAAGASRQGADRSAAAFSGEALSRAAREGSSAEGWYGASGWGVYPSEPEILALFELAEPFRIPQSAEEGDSPFSPAARMLWRLPEGGYVGGLMGRPHTLYWPVCPRSGSAPVGPPPLAPPARCTARWNRQSGRWEVIAPAPIWRRFEMTAGLSCGQSAEARTIVFDHQGGEHRGTPPGEVIMVYDSLAMFSKPPTAAEAAGAMGMAVFAADRNRWEIVAMQTPADFLGTLAQDCHRWDTTAAVWPQLNTLSAGYNPFGAGVSQPTIVMNIAGGGNQTIGPPLHLPAQWFSGREGDRVLCRWHIRGGYYYLAGIEPNDLDYQPLDVLTRTTLTIDFAGQSFSHRRYARQIRLPPWTTIGPEVEV